MKLFQRTREHSAEKVAKMVEAALKAVGVDPAGCRNDEGPEDEPHVAWTFVLPSTGHDIFLILRPEEEANALEVRCLVAKIPQDGILPFYRRLLELNAEALMTAAFGISGQYAVLSARRPTTDLDSSEIVHMIWAVASYTAEYGKDLKDEFACPDWNDE